MEAFDPPVYPAAPDEPRFIFERSLRYNTNVEPLTTSKKLRRYATGEVDDIRGLGLFMELFLPFLVFYSG